VALGYLLVAVLTAAVAIFALQNGTPVVVRFLVWTIRDVSIAALTLVSLATGLVLAGLPLSITRWRLRSRARTLEIQVKQLQTALADRDRALLAQRPPTEPR
jgi:uncharacterized integral membrane protein